MAIGSAFDGSVCDVQAVRYCVNQIGNLPVAIAHCPLPVIALSHLINVVDRRWWCPTTLVEDKKEKLIEQVSRTVAILIIC